MDVICYDDILNHYQIKLKEAFDEIEKVCGQLGKVEEHLEIGWVGPAADACRTKVESVTNELTKSLTDISEAIIKLSDVLATFETDGLN